MSELRCHLCGQVLAEGATTYQVDIRVHAVFDGVIPQAQEINPAQELDSILSSLSSLTEEEITRQVYEHDVFVMCPPCKEAFLKDLYARLHPTVSPQATRAHLIN